VEDYKQPKEFGDEDELTKHIRSEGCAPQLPQSEKEESEEEEDYVTPVKKVKKGNHGNHEHRIQIYYNNDNIPITFSDLQSIITESKDKHQIKSLII
jgi:hypothetical protein